MTRADEAHDRFQSLLWGFASHRIITVAGRTGVLRALAEGEPRTPEAIAEACGLDPLATGKVVRALTALGVAEAVGDRYVMPGELAGFFVPGAMDLSHFLEHSHDMYTGWGENLETWLKGGEWTTRPRAPDGAARFARAMQAMGGHVAERVARTLDMSGRRRMLDLGGGVGHFAEAFCRRNDRLEAVVLDTPTVADLGTGRLRDTPLAKRIRFVGGDYLETPVDGTFDMVLLANVLHQESTAKAAGLVKRGAECLERGGMLAVLDFSIDEQQRETPVGALFAVNMRSFGDTYNAPTIAGWMTGAGLEGFRRTDVGRHRWLLTALKP